MEERSTETVSNPKNVLSSKKGNSISKSWTSSEVVKTFKEKKVVL